MSLGMVITFFPWTLTFLLFFFGMNLWRINLDLNVSLEKSGSNCGYFYNFTI